jgi:hypothetical protein
LSRFGRSLGVSAVLVLALAGCSNDKGSGPTPSSATTGPTAGPTTSATPVPGPTTSATPTAGCSAVTTPPVPKAKDYHTNRKTFGASDYNSVPPAGGFHSLKFLSGGEIITAKPDLGAIVHSMDHGMVILWTNNLSPDQLNDAKSTFNALGKKGYSLAMVELSDMDVPFAMTSWGHLQKCGSVDTGAIEEFVTTYYARSPEASAVCQSAAILGDPLVPNCKNL